MTALKALGIVYGTALICGAAGALIGALLGWLVPSYYRSVFFGGHEHGFDPVAVGLGQGLSQGLLAGLGVGFAILFLMIWREVALEKAAIARWRAEHGIVEDPAPPSRKKD